MTRWKQFLVYTLVSVLSYLSFFFLWRVPIDMCHTSAPTLQHMPRHTSSEPKVVDQDAMGLIRSLEDQAPIDEKVGQAITALWGGEWEMGSSTRVVFV